MTKIPFYLGVVTVGTLLIHFCLFHPGLHSFVFQAFLGSNYSIERQQLFNHFVIGSSLEPLHFSDAELRHIKDIDHLLLLWRLVLIMMIVVTTLGLLLSRAWEKQKILREALTEINLVIFFAVVVVAVVLVLQFEPLFTAAHRWLFVAGNWSFDPNRDLIIQLYPPEFFQFLFLITLSLLAPFHLTLFYLVRRFKPRR